MKIDHTGQAIRQLTKERNLQVEVEELLDLDGTVRRYWFFFNDRGQPLINGAGVCLHDAAAMAWLESL